MAQIQRKQKIEDSLELLDERGNVCYTLPVDLDLEQVFVRVSRARKNAALAEEALRKEGANAAEKTLEAYGKAVTELFASVFGDAGAEKIVAHYSGRYSEMLLDILPYLIENVFPRLDNLSSERIKQAVELRRAVDSASRKGGRSKRRRRR